MKDISVESLIQYEAILEKESRMEHAKFNTLLREAIQLLTAPIYFDDNSTIRRETFITNAKSLLSGK